MNDISFSNDERREKSEKAGKRKDEKYKIKGGCQIFYYVNSWTVRYKNKIYVPVGTILVQRDLLLHLQSQSCLLAWESQQRMKTERDYDQK